MVMPIRPASTSCFTFAQGYSSCSSQRAERSRNSWSASVRARARRVSCSAVSGNRTPAGSRAMTAATVGPSAGRVKATASRIVTPRLRSVRECGNVVVGSGVPGNRTWRAQMRARPVGGHVMIGRWSASATLTAWAIGAGFAARLVTACPSGVSADAGGGGGGGGGEASQTPAKPEDPDYSAGVKAINAKQYAAAIPLLQKATARDGTNADAFNMLAYATRKNGDPAGAIPIYEKALAIDPKHRGAHEYIGEAYLTRS